MESGSPPVEVSPTRIEASFVATAVRFARLPTEVIQERPVNLRHSWYSRTIAERWRFALPEEARARQRAELQALCARASQSLRAVSHEGQRRIYTERSTVVPDLVPGSAQGGSP